jgi:hypothetical protein
LYSITITLRTFISHTTPHHTNKTYHRMLFRSNGYSVQKPIIQSIRSSTSFIPPKFPSVGESVEMSNVNPNSNSIYQQSNWKLGSGFDTRCSRDFDLDAYQGHHCSVHDIHYYYMLHNILLELSSSLINISNKAMLSNQVLDAFGKSSDSVRGMRITAGGLLDDFPDFL